MIAHSMKHNNKASPIVFFFQVYIYIIYSITGGKGHKIAFLWLVQGRSKTDRAFIIHLLTLMAWLMICANSHCGKY